MEIKLKIQISYLLTLLILLFTIPACCTHSPLNRSDDSSQISKTVLLFAETYGTGRMDEAAFITTMNFRDGLPASVWVAKTWPILKAYEYEKINTEILSTEIEGDKAIVIVQAKINTAGGNAVQKEIYYLIRFQGKWLVDDLQVMEEDVEATEIEI